VSLDPVTRIYVAILVVGALWLGLQVLKRRLRESPLRPDDPTTLTFRCPTCGSTLIYGMEKCDSCGVVQDPDEALESAAIAFFINRAISRANTLFTFAPAGIAVGLMAAFSHAFHYKLGVILALINTLLFSGAVVVWSYRHRDLNISHAGFQAARQRMGKHFHFWLAACAIQIILVILLW